MVKETWYPVRIYFPEVDMGYIGILPEDVFEDAIRGTTPLNALKNAMWNWPDAVWVELI